MVFFGFIKPVKCSFKFKFFFGLLQTLFTRNEVVFFLAKIITTCGFCCWLIIWVNCVLLAVCCTAKVLPIHGILSAHFWPTITSFILIFLSFFQSINFIHNFPLLSDVNQQFTLEFGTNYCLLLPTFYLIARYSCYFAPFWLIFRSNFILLFFVLFYTLFVAIFFWCFFRQSWFWSIFSRLFFFSFWAFFSSFVWCFF